MVAPSSEAPVGDEAPRSVVDRALAILDTFRSGCERQSLSGISRRSGLPVATVYRLVQRLTVWGALERSEDGRYRIGLRLWEVGSLAPRSTELQHVARPFMQDLYEMTRLSVQLAIREGHELISVEYLRRPRQGVAGPRIVGQRVGLHTTAIGQVLLAHAPVEVREKILAGPLTRLTPNTCVDPDELDRLLAQVRHRGYAISDRQANLRILGVAAPIHGPDGSVDAALALVCDHATAAVRNMTQAVRVTASGISRAFRETQTRPYAAMATRGHAQPA